MERAGAQLTVEQWSQVIRLLEEKYVLGFELLGDGGPDLACDLAQRCDFPVAAAWNETDDLLCFVRLNEDDDGK